ncbi:DUF4040 domain-containing protein [Anaplasma marginale]|uniref:DUF4040 domain-containing protein n=1 Tax=Anaplasma marginale TaxID=770 RepID=UPI0004097736|nr:DUF4040 domain-containing protein [Anaplasma marginale]
MHLDVGIAVNWMLLPLLVVSAAAVALCEGVFVNTIVMCTFSLTMAAAYLVMAAPDVAITEAAVGAGLSTALTLVVLSSLGYVGGGKVGYVWNDCSAIRILLAASIALSMFLALVGAVLDLPEFGDATSPANIQTAAYFEHTSRYVGIPNVVTAILASFRGYDTMCETLVVFTAAMCVSLLRMGEVRKVPKGKYVFPGSNPALRSAVTIMLPVMILYGLYVQIHGDYSPGGGFQGGVIVASALVLYHMVFGEAQISRVVSASFPRVMSATGFLLYVATGAISMIAGKSFLSYFFCNVRCCFRTETWYIRRRIGCWFNGVWLYGEHLF